MTSKSGEKYTSFDPKAFEWVRKRCFGNGHIGGKAKGWVFAKEVVKEKFQNILYPETFFVTTEIFDEFIKLNNLEEITKQEDYERLKELFLGSKLPPSFEKDLENLLQYVDYPLAIRSSSLLEDSIKYSFAGKYLTQFSANRGSLEERLEYLKRCIKLIFASTYNPAAKEYRRKHGLGFKEKMAVMIQQLAGKNRGGWFYPEIAGIAFSKVFRRWSPRIKREDGMIRMCFGIGTRTTDRAYARNFYLTNPSLRPEGQIPQEIVRHSQELFDYVDLFNNCFATSRLTKVIDRLIKYHRNISAFVKVYDGNELYWLYSTFEDPLFKKYVFTFDGLPTKFKGFFSFIKEILSELEDKMGIAVDMEFTFETEEKQLYLIQSRPLTSYEEFGKVEIPDVPEEKIIFKGDRMVSNGKLELTNYLVYVDYEEYTNADDKFSVARALAVVNASLEGKRYILVGPGRWGSSNPLLGVPVKYNEISNCGCLVEVGVPSQGYVPELSYGTHFFLDLDVDGILYLPVYVNECHNIFNKKWLDSKPYEKGGHNAIRIYKGEFSVYLDGEDEIGIVFER